MLCTLRSKAWPIRRDLWRIVSHIKWSDIRFWCVSCLQQRHYVGNLKDLVLTKPFQNTETYLKCMAVKLKSNRGFLSHAADVTGFLGLCDPRPYLTPTSLKRFMKRGPKRQGLWRWHCRELTVIWVARCDATATMNTASYIKAASVCGGGRERKMCFLTLYL